LEQLGWVNSMEFVSPDEITLTQPLVEGAVCQITVNAYERNPKARRQCIEEHGRACCICSFSFGEAYGPVAEKVIHVHHLRALSEIGEEYDVDPLKDLRPLCPNCHAVLHLRKPTPFSIQEVRELLGGKIIRAVTPNEGAATVRHEA
jgi:predicted HNH restriction endonuclease